VTGVEGSECGGKALASYVLAEAKGWVLPGCGLTRLILDRRFALLTIRFCGRITQMAKLCLREGRFGGGLPKDNPSALGPECDKPKWLIEEMCP